MKKNISRINHCLTAIINTCMYDIDFISGIILDYFILLLGSPARATMSARSPAISFLHQNSTEDVYTILGQFSLFTKHKRDTLKSLLAIPLVYWKPIWCCLRPVIFQVTNSTKYFDCQWKIEAVLCYRIKRLNYFS